MLTPVAICLLMNLTGLSLPGQEPDGSRTIGIVPPYRSEPAPPAWLRTRSHAAARVSIRHYIYEAYAGPGGQWLVRYQLLPEDGEACAAAEQVLLFQSDLKKKPRPLEAARVKFESRIATWNNQPFSLVDRRDLMRP